MKKNPYPTILNHLIFIIKVNFPPCSLLCFNPSLTYQVPQKKTTEKKNKDEMREDYSLKNR